MNTRTMRNILSLFLPLICFSVGWGQTVTVTNVTNSNASSPLIGGSTNRVLFGFNVDKATGGVVEFTSLVVATSADPNSVFSSVQLFRANSAGASETSSGSTVVSGTVTLNTSNITFTPTTNIFSFPAGNDNRNFFLIATVRDDVATTSGGIPQIQLSLTQTGVAFTGSPTVTAFSIAGPMYSFQALTTTVNSLNSTTTNGVTASPLVGGSSSTGIFGFSVSSNGSQSLSQINIQFDDNPSTVFGTVGTFSLVQSTDVTLTSSGDNSVVPGTFSYEAGNVLRFTPAPALALTSTPRNLFVLASVLPTVGTASSVIQASIAGSNLVVSPNPSGTSGSFSGIDYGTVALTTTVTSLNSVSTNGVNASPLVGGTTAAGIFGFGLASNGSQSVSQINIQFDSDPALVFGAVGDFVLVQSTDATLSSTGDNSNIAGTFTYESGNVLRFVPSSALALTTTPKNFFVRANVLPTMTTASSVIQATLAGANLVVSPNPGGTGGTSSGIDYGTIALTATVSSLNSTSTNGLTGSPLVAGTNSVGMFGFALASNGSQAVSQINIQFDSNPSLVFDAAGAFVLLESTDVTLSTAGDNTTVTGTFTYETGNVLRFVPSVSLNLTSTARNFFVRANVLGSVVTAPSVIQASLAGANLVVSPNPSGTSGSSTGIDYGTQGITATLTNIPPGTSPVQTSSVLEGGTTDLVVAGFSIVSNNSQTLTEINFNLSGVASQFSNIKLFKSSTSGSVGASLVTGNTTGIFTGLSETITTATSYYYLVVSVAGNVTTTTPGVTINTSAANITISGDKSSLTINRSLTFTQSNTTAFAPIGNEQNQLDFSEYNKQTAAGLTSTNSERIFTFTIADNDPDGLPTNLTNITLQLSNTQFLRAVALFNGAATSPFGEAATSGTGTTTVLLSGSPLISVPDNTTVTVHVHVTFGASVADNQSVGVTVQAATAASTGSGITSISGVNSNTTGLNDFNVIATEQRFFGISNPINPNTNFGFSIEATDANGNRDVNMTGNVTITESSPATPPTFFALDAGGSMRAYSGGVVAWTQFRIAPAGGYTLRADHDGSLPDEDQAITVESLGVNITGPANQNFCFGGPFQTLTNIVITESDPSDFAAGTNVTYSIILPAGFEFNLGATVTATATGSNLSAVSSTSPAYPSSSIYRFQYTANNAAPAIDAITISGLQVRYVGTTAVSNQPILRIGGTAVVSGSPVDNPEPHGTLSAAMAATVVNFSVDEIPGDPEVNPSETRFSINSKAVRLIGSPAGGTFSGNGVINSGGANGFTFNPSLLTANTYAITYRFVDAGGCVVTISRDFEVFASFITALNLEYCSNSSASGNLGVPTSRITDRFGSGTNVLNDFVYWTGSGWAPIPASGDPATTTVFDPGNALFTTSINTFGGVYVGYRVRTVPPGNVVNTTQIEWQFIRVFIAPTLAFNLPTASCEFNAPITLVDAGTTLVSPRPLSAATDNFTGSVAIQNSGGNNWSLLPGNVPTASLGTPLNITYNYRDPATNCTNSITRQITVFPRPSNIPASDIEVSATQATTTIACQGNTPPAFTAAAGPGISYRWYADAGLTDLRSTTNTFTPPVNTSTPGSTPFYVARVINGCQSFATTLTATINAQAVVDAGTPTILCSGVPLTLSGLGASITNPAGVGTWSSRSPVGSQGTFRDISSNVNDVFATAVTYTPSANEVTTGSFTLRLTSGDPDGAGPCTTAFDQVTITINSVAQVNAGLDQTVCAGQAINLAATISGAASSVTWTAPRGSFSNATNLISTYTPTAADLANGTTIPLTITTNDPIGPCDAASDQLTLVINQAPAVDAGFDRFVCQSNVFNLGAALPSIGGSATSAVWSAEIGGVPGTFTGNTGVANSFQLTSFTPDASRFGVTQLRLTTNDPDGAGPCIAATDVMTLTTNQAATISAMADKTYCATDPVLIEGTTGGSTSSVQWSRQTGTGGSFVNANSTNTTFILGASDRLGTAITLRISSNDPDGTDPISGPCPIVTDDVVLTINRAAEVNAGSDRFVCQNSSILLSQTNPSIGGDASSATWAVLSGTTGVLTGNTGTGTSYLNTTFAPNTTGLTALRLTTNDPDGSGPCVAVSDDVVITTNQAALITAMADRTYCATDVIALEGTTGGSTSSVQWTRQSGAGGSFGNANATNTNFALSSSDRLGTAITFRIASNDPDGTDPISGPCPIVTDDVVLTINRAAEVNAGSDRFVCQNSSILLSQTNPSIGGDASSATWAVLSGTAGVLTGNTGTGTSFLNTSFAPATTGITTLRLTTNDPDGTGPCVAVSDDVTITTNLAAIVSAGADAVFCAGNDVTLTGATAGSTSSTTWSRVSGSGGSFDNASAPNTFYRPTAFELSNGATITFRITSNDPDGSDPIAGPCPAVQDEVDITINQRPEVNAGADQILCADEPVVLSATLIGSATSGNWSGGAGSFVTPSALSTAYNLSTNEQTGDLTVAFTFTTNDSDGAGPCVPGTDLVLVSIKPVPGSPVITDPGEYCVGDVILPLEAVGAPNSTVRWYRDAAISNLAGTGNSFATGVPNTFASQTRFYATQTVNGCESNVPPAFEDVIINPLPVTQFREADFCLDPAGNGVDFESTSTIPAGSVVKWGWSFGDLDRLDRETGNIPAGTHQGATTGTFERPSHRYRTFGDYSVALTTESDKGCISSTSKTITIEPIPDPNFQFRDVCATDNTRFDYIGTFASFIGGAGGYAWDFGDGGATSTAAQPSHRFTGSGNYTVRLRVTTNLGCTGTKTKTVSVLPLVSVSNDTPYTQDFETSNHGWFSEGFTPRTPTVPDQYFNSWQVTQVSRDQGNTRAWITRDDAIGTYRNDERSVLNTPCFVVGNNRPVISFDYRSNTDDQRDGAYLEVSVDNGLTWEVFPRPSQATVGLNWYNRDAITGLSQVTGKEQTGPIGQTVGQIGWSGSQDATKWKNGRYSIDFYRSQRVRFRYVFGSNSDQPSTEVFDGFALDNFSVESRNRLVLVENFTNAAAPAATTNNDRFRNFPNIANNPTATTEIVKVQYHTSFPGADPINAQNAIDPNARAAFYGVTAAPRAYIDGVTGTPTFAFSGSQEGDRWDANAYSRQSLATSPIEISITPTRDGNTLNANLSVRAVKQSIPAGRYIVFVGVLESNVGNENFVLRKFLPSAAGTPLPALTVGGTAFTSTFSWPIDSRNFAASTPAALNLSVVAFVQAAQPDPLTQVREVLQAAINTTPVPTFDSFTTGLEALTGDAIATYPNPAKELLTVQLPFEARERIGVTLVDQLGKRVQNGELTPGNQQTILPVAGLAAGVYILQVGSGPHAVRKKVVIAQ